MDPDRLKVWVSDSGHAARIRMKTVDDSSVSDYEGQKKSRLICVYFDCSRTCKLVPQPDEIVMIQNRVVEPPYPAGLYRVCKSLACRSVEVVDCSTDFWPYAIAAILVLVCCLKLPLSRS